MMAAGARVFRKGAGRIGIPVALGLLLSACGAKTINSLLEAATRKHYPGPVVIGSDLLEV